MIQIKQLRKSYTLGKSKIEVLQGIDLLINKGEMVAITGSSGSGKSTLMNILGCLDRPDSGEYILSGQEVSKLSKDRLAEIRNRYIGFVFQSFNLLPRMSALENVELPLMYAGETQTKYRAQAALEEVGLGDRMDHEPNQLSGGQRQRVAVARAIVMDPGIILADEPTGNLDSKTSEEIMNLFSKLNARGSTIIVITHEPDIARYCQRRVHMKDGRIINVS